MRELKPYLGWILLRGKNMTFEKRLAKIGKGKYTNLYINNDHTISIITGGEILSQKELKVSNERYALNDTGKYMAGEQGVMLSSNILVVSDNNEITLEEI